MTVAETSLSAYRNVELTLREHDVMLMVHKFYGDGRWFTRAELANSMGWAINRITGRVVDLIEKGYLEEDKSRTVQCKITKGAAHPLRLSIAPRDSHSAGKTDHGLAVVAAHGAQPDTTSEAYRAACEAQYVATLGSDAVRSKYLEGVEKRRGHFAADQLRKAAWALIRRTR